MRLYYRSGTGREIVFDVVLQKRGRQIVRDFDVVLLKRDRQRDIL